MSEKELNTKVVFGYRDGDNYKFSTSYILQGALSVEEMEYLNNHYKNASNLLVPPQISLEFSLVCPSNVDSIELNYKSVNENKWNDEIDHCYHNLHVTSVDKDFNCKISAREFYDTILDTIFFEINNYNN